MIKRRSIAAVFFAALFLRAGVPDAAGPTSLIIVGAPVYTMDEELPRAQAIAVTAGEILFVGSVEEVMARRGERTRVIELSPGQCVLPGFVDAHGHLYNLGRVLSEVRLFETASSEECLERVRVHQRDVTAGEWIAGRGWDQNDWDVREFPTWRDLEGTEANPVYLRRVGGHAGWLNRTALDAVGITRDTPDPPGGRIVRDADGDPTGIVIDNAKKLVTQRMPAPTPAVIRARLLRAADHCIRLGLVGMHDAGTTAGQLRVLKAMAVPDEWKLRVYCMLDADDAEVLDTYLDAGPASYCQNRVIVRSLKLYADGALGSRGALLIAPYSDDAENIGLAVRTQNNLESLSRRALAAGMQVCTHAIGDGGCRTTLDVYEHVLGERAAEDHRFRVEHAQIVNDADFARFRSLGVVPSMQPTHATSDMYWAEDRLGPERIRGAYAWRRFLDQGSVLPLGSDFPVESVNPLWGIYAAVTRTDHDGWPEGGWYPDQRLSVEEAIRGFTTHAVYAEFAEESRGTLSVGKRADIVVLDRDLFEIEPSEILATRVLYTVIDGDVAYESSGAD